MEARPAPARRDIGAVSIAPPHHGHGILAAIAARQIHCEKPLAQNFEAARGR
jgi:predicted dehydrogenase